MFYFSGREINSYCCCSIPRHQTSPSAMGIHKFAPWLSWLLTRSGTEPSFTSTLIHFVFVYSKGSGETVRMCRVVLAFAVHEILDFSHMRAAQSSLSLHFSYNTKYEYR